MAWTSSDIATLEDAIRERGFVRRLQFADQAVEFDSVDDMLKLLAVMKQEVAARPRTRYGVTSKGL